jgi:ATP-dependent DNA ligase
VLDGEAVILGVDGVFDFNALHSGKHNEEVQLCAFDILFEGDDDLRRLPLNLRKTSLERLLARRPEGIFVNPFERGEIGPDLFRVACNMGLEGLVSKRRDRPYQAGRSKHWVKVKNRKHPAMDRVMESFHGDAGLSLRQPPEDDLVLIASRMFAARRAGREVCPSFRLVECHCVTQAVPFAKALGWEMARGSPLQGGVTMQYFAFV